jgi:hypothetical protein
VLEHLYNKRLSKGRSSVENAPGILKQCFRELLGMTDLHVIFVPDVIICCCLLHNVLLVQNLEEVARLVDILQQDGMLPKIDDDPVVDPGHEAPPTVDFARADIKRTELGL